MAILSLSLSLGFIARVHRMSGGVWVVCASVNVNVCKYLVVTAGGWFVGGVVFPSAASDCKCARKYSL